MANEKFIRWRPHPWHGIRAGSRVPEFVTAYIEITPVDSVKYEVDKHTGYLKVDRPHKTSLQSPLLYGFIPQTLCGDHVQKLSPESSQGDNDPLDICVISERAINRSDVILSAKVIGGLRMIDDHEADDKIIGVLETDNIYNNINEVNDLPAIMMERLKHYFLHYKLLQHDNVEVKIVETYGAKDAKKVVMASIADYQESFPDVEMGITSF